MGFKIYTCGKMSGLSYDEQMRWRLNIQNLIQERTSKSVTFIHPPLYFNYFDNNHKSEREILEWEMAQICDCNIVLVDLTTIDDTIGSHMELGACNAINMFGGRHIFVVGIGKSQKPLHPWIEETCIRIEEYAEAAAEFVCDYLLV